MRHHPWTSFSRHALSAAVAIVVAAPVMAQNTTSAVSGRVADASGKPVAGATVTILHTPSGSVSTSTTDSDGRYAARGLRVGGPYTITIRQGSQTDTREGVVLALAETLTLDATLGNATVVVTGQALNPTFSRSNMGAGTSISSAQLNALASIQRNLQDYARTDPRVGQTDKERGRISAGGQNFRYNSVTIDGVTTNDTFGLEDNNLPTLKQPISIDAIQSAQVNISNYDVTQKGYTGANINAVTKSGTNEFKGSVYYVFRDERLVGRRLNDTTGIYFNAPVFKEDTKGFTLGGPIIKDKLFFFANYEELRSSRSTPSFGPVGDSRTNVLINQSAIDGAATIASQTYGVDVGSYTVPKGVELVVKDTLLKLDWTITDDHRASLRYNKTEQSEPQFPSIGTTALSYNSFWYPQDKAITSVVGQWFADWTPSFSTELKLSKRDYESVPTTPLSMPQVALTFTGLRPTGTGTGTRNASLFLGTEASRHFNELATNTQDAYFAGTWNLGAHEIKGGVDISRNDVFNAFVQNTKGNYVFSCINSSATFAYDFGNINCATATAAQVDAAVLENFRRGRPLSYTYATAATGRKVEEAAANWSLTNTGLFLQDTWTVNKQLAVTLGLRLDQSSSSDTPLANAAAAAPVVAGTVTGLGTGTRQTGGFGIDNTKTLDGASLWQPRIGFNWALDPADRRKGQLRGGVGLFQGEAASVWLSNPYSNTGVVLRTVGCGSGTLGACPATDGLFQADPALQPTTGLGSSTPQANVDFLAPNVKQPAVWKLNLAFDRELPWFGLQAGAEWIHTRTNSAIYYQQLNLGAATGTGPDGRPMYYNANGYDRDCWTAGGTSATGGVGCAGAVSSRALSNSAYNNVLQVTDTKQGSGNQLTLSLRQQPMPELSWQAAYTRTTSTEVSPLTSSTAGSNYGNRAIFNPNEEVTANSAYLIRDRVSAAVTWSKALIGRYKTTVGLFYEGRKGVPYSWTYFNDLNGDSVAGNDLMYIPKGPGSGEVIFAGGAAEETKFWEIVAANPELNGARGKTVKRAGSFNPFVNSFDLRFSQELPGFTSKHKGVFTLDLLNVGNMLDKRWGHIKEVGFNLDRFGAAAAGGGIARSFVNYRGMQDGKYVYSLGNLEPLGTKQVKGESQWAVQATLRYEF